MTIAQIADYSILIKSGFTKYQAMGSQFFTAVGAFVGTFLGIWIAETSGTGKGEALKIGEGLFGTSVGAGELVIPMTAGGECGVQPHATRHLDLRGWLRADELLW